MRMSGLDMTVFSQTAIVKNPNWNRYLKVICGNLDWPHYSPGRGAGGCLRGKYFYINAKITPACLLGAPIFGIWHNSRELVAVCRLQLKHLQQVLRNHSLYFPSTFGCQSSSGWYSSKLPAMILRIT